MENKELIERLENISRIADNPIEFVEKEFPEFIDNPYPAALGTIAGKLYLLLFEIKTGK